MVSIDDFRNFFDQQMLPDMAMLDQRRRMVLRRSTIIVVLMVVLLAILIGLYYIVGPDAKGNGAVWAIIGAVILISSVVALSWWAPDKTFHSDFKTLVIGRIVKFIGSDLVYEPKNYVGSDSFERSRIFLRNVDRYSGDDMIRGQLDKTQLWFSEVKAEYKSTTTDSKGHRKTTWHTIFKGMFFIADFNKHFQTSTVVLPNRLGKGFVADFFNKMNLTRKEKHIKLEDPDFNKHFVVYGEDQIEARYILSTALMQRITEFKQKHNKPIYISFVNSFLYVAISYSKNLFEPNYFKKLTNFNLVREFFEDIHLAVSIVEELNLNNRIWTKQ